MSCLYIDADNILYKMMEKIVNHIEPERSQK